MYLNTQNYDGVLGFSQGAVAVALLCGEKEVNNPPELSTLKFALPYSGFKPRADAYQALFSKQLQTPTLHTWGLSDVRLPESTSKRFFEIFAPETRRTFEHKGGHLVPSDKASRRCVEDFLLEIWHAEYGRGEARDNGGRANL